MSFNLIMRSLIKNKKVAIFSLSGVILIVLTFYFWGFEPDFAKGRVNNRVVFGEKDLSGWNQEDVEKYVQEIAFKEKQIPIDAKIDFDNIEIIPEKDGFLIDTETTVEAIMNAPAQQTVLPVYRRLPARLKWDEHPALPAYRGNSQDNNVSLMINVAWGEEYLEDILKVLQKHNINATFFLVGKWAENNPNWVRKIFSKGHELGNHGYNDAEVMTELSSKNVLNSLQRTNEIIETITGKKPEYFTPHKGEFNNLTLETVSRESMRTVLWSLDTVDWKQPGLEAMEKKIKNNIQSGDLILMHPTENIAELLNNIIPYLQEQDFHIITVREHFCPFPYFPETEYMERQGREK